jgi:hypothetical protein
MMEIWKYFCQLNVQIWPYGELMALVLGGFVSYRIQLQHRHFSSCFSLDNRDQNGTGSRRDLRDNHAPGPRNVVPFTGLNLLAEVFDGCVH